MLSTLTEHSLAARIAKKQERLAASKVVASTVPADARMVVQGCTRDPKFCDCEVCRPAGDSRRHCIPTSPVRVFYTVTRSKESAEAQYRLSFPEVKNVHIVELN